MPGGHRDDSLEIREANAADVPAVLSLLRSAMDRGGDDRFERLFRWKHLDNVFGISPAWVATDGDAVVAARYLMRWEWRHGGDRLRAVRAVDTATDPGYQGRGLFTRLTRHALSELASGTDFVFNTPNDQSRPGYLKMGWVVVGRLRPSIVPCSVAGLGRALRARVPAAHWSLESRAGVSAAEALADTATIDGLLEASPATGHLETARDVEFLRWRYAAGPLTYRVVRTADAMAIVRVRARGRAREGVLADVLAPDTRARAHVIRAVRRQLDADYLLGFGLGWRDRAVPLAGQGPVLTHRALGAGEDAPPLRSWAVTLGDIEVF